MSKDVDDIREQAEKWARRFGPAAIVPATVAEINQDDTISVTLATESVIPDVRLKSAVKAGNKQVRVPEVGSMVLIGRIDNSDEWVVLSMDEISQALTVIGNTRFEITENGFLVKQGDETLKDLLSDTLDAIKSVSAELQKVVVAIGVSPDLIALQQIDAAIDAINSRNDQIFN
jgi:hypothetical protein